MRGFDGALQELHHEIANAASQLKTTSDFPSLVPAVAEHLRQAGIRFSALWVHLIERDLRHGRSYALLPGPASWVDQPFTMDMAPLAAHIDQGLRLWQGPQALWVLTVPTARGAVEIAGEGMAGFSLEEQQLLVSVAPSLQVLSLRHRDLELVEAAVSAGVLPEAGREVVSPNLAEAGGRGQDTAPLILENSRLRQELKAAAEELRQSRHAAPRQVLFAADQGPVNLFDDIVAESPIMRKVVELARLTTTTDNTVLILGESGTGKDLLAHAIHTHSRRSAGPLVVVNSARLSNGLEDSELFGHLKGAFTSAHRENLGMVAAAHGGTLFLDEIGELALTSQAKLLRCLETGEVRPVGGSQVREVDIRFIAATNRDLRQAVQEGTFRADLYYRLAVIAIQIPPLRQRPEDLPWLICRFLGPIAREMGRERCEIAPAALEVLIRAPWPGNARQLDSALRHAALFSGGRTIEKEHLPDDLLLPQQQAPASTDPELALSEIERQHILQVLEQCGRDRQQAQALLGISRATLQRRLKEYGIAP